MSKNSTDCAGAPSASKRVWTATAVAFVLAVVAFAAAPNPSVRFERAKDSPAFVSCVEFKGEYADFAELADFSPMFIPTRWNYVAANPKPPTPEDWNIAAPETVQKSAKLLSPEFLAKEKSDMEIGRMGIFRSILRSAFAEIGRSDNPVSVRQSLASLSLVDMRTGKTEASIKMPQEASNSPISSGEFYVTVFDDGWIGRPLVKESTGAEALDARIIKMLSLKKLFRNVKSGDYKAVYIP